MKLAVMSDIHGNWDALIAVLHDIEQCGVDDTVCLGDCIGYGPEPQRVIDTLKRRDIPTVLGNHDLTVTRPDSLNWFNPMARQSLVKTIAMLSDAGRTYLAKLEPVRIHHGCRLVHGFPPDSPTVYRFEVPPAQQLRIFEKMDERLCFIGHTHDLNIIGLDDRRVTDGPLLERVCQLTAGRRYIISAGSVGQPRDGNNNAKYLIWDDAADTIETRYVAYDIAGVVDKMLAAGLPEVHARRLWG
jgi:predicted phosphodiesterase